MLFKCEPFDTFLAAVGVGGWVGGVFEICFAAKKKKKRKKLVWNSQLELNLASYSGACGEWTAAFALL